MALTELKIQNRALAKIAAKRVTAAQLAADSTIEAIHCNIHYEPTRDSLQRSHYWRFARARKTLAQDTTDPDFEWDNQFILPNDFLRFRSIYEEDGTTSRSRRHDIEGQRFLTNYSTVNLRYIKKVTDVIKFDPLFVEVLVLQLALKLVGSLAGGDDKLERKIERQLDKLVPKVVAVDSDETNTGGRSDWILARHGGIGIASQEERFW